MAWSTTATLLVLSFSALFIGLVDSACKQHDIRLRNGPTAREGRVEYCLNNQWGTVCDDLWGLNDAQVVCNQLNYDPNGAEYYRQAAYGAGTGPILLDNVRCYGQESALRYCPRNSFGVHNCNHNEDAGVYCPACYEGNVWIVGGNTLREGTVEVCHAGVWSSVCDDQWGVNDAKVVCRMLGYNTTGASAFTNAYFGQRYGPIILDNVQCTGNEKNIFNCSANALGVNNCNHNEDAGVRCPPCDKGSIRLWSAYSSTPPGEGMLQYCHNSREWKAMCKHEWGCIDAKVACRNLGYNGSLSITALTDVEGAYGYFRPVLPQRVRCAGDEPVLQSCGFQYTSWCNGVLTETAGVRCAETVVGHGCTAGDLRLQNGAEPGEGRLEFCFHNEWSPFCQLQDQEATVACKQLGYTAYPWATIFYDERFGSAGYISDFRNISCSPMATENHMSNCTINYKPACGVFSCWKEFGIKCFNPGMCTDGQVRLADGDIEQEGRLEVCYKGVWGVIVGRTWSNIDAYVACKQLGYTAARSPNSFWGSFFGQGVYPMIWRDVGCGGWEKSLLDCSRTEYLNFQNGRGNIIGIRCYEDCTNGDIRLVGGTDGSQGTIEVCIDNLWGLIDASGWSDLDSAVVCRQLGYSTESFNSYYNSEFGRPNKTVHLTNVYCIGAEDILMDCTFASIALNDGKSSYKNASVAGVDCQPSPPTPPPCVTIGYTAPAVPQCTPDNSVRLQGGNASMGRVEVCFNGTWTPLCQLDLPTASILCQDLGYIYNTWASVGNDGSYGLTTNYSYVSNITCDSGANSLSSCSLDTADCVPNCPNANIWLRCYTPGTCTQNDIRLADGYVPNEGRVEICNNGVWGSICDQGWDATDAHVVCVQLGHPELTPVVFHNSYFGSGYGPIGYSSIGCGGWETAIGSCSNVTFPSFACGRDRTAGVLCGADCYNGQLRLMGGSDRTQGSVEVCFDNVWGNIAETGWGDKDAQLACSLMGFLADGAIPYYGSYYGKTSPTILITDLYCTGEEVNLFECTMTRHSVVDGRDLLGTQHVAGVQCMTNDTCIPPPPIGGSQCTTGDVQLSSNGLGSGSSGNLQYCYNGTWTPFCTLDRNTAIVACRKLGYADYTWATIFDDGRFMPSSNVSYFQNFTCQGVETSFSACTINDNCVQVCPVPYAIQCYDPIGCPEGAVRLVGGYIAQEGRVEVCMNGIWSGICADGAWGKVDALVVCNQLGLGIGEPMIYTDSSVYGEPYGPIVYSNVSCKGYETNVAQCVKATYPNIQCSRSQVAGLFCTDVCTDGDIKLVGGSTPNEGTVVICKNKVWGLIAQTGWDVNDAKVVCNQLGYPTTGAMPVINSQYGKPNLTLQSSGVTCAGSESSINDCPATWLSLDMGKTIVSHVDVVGVYCSPGTPPPGCQLPPDYSTPVCTDGDVQFDGSSTTDGLLQYCYKGQWSYFCSIDAATANVACKQMGFNLYSWASLITNGQFGSGMGYTLFDSLTCSGSESTLKSCNIVDPGQCLTKCSVSMAIRCYQPGVCNEGDVRLADGAIPQRGRVEICKNGVWGTICDQGWDNSDAFSLCKGLGYYGKTSQAYSGSAFGAGYGPAIYSNLQCGGWENSTDACAKDTYPTISCSSDQTAGALCTSGCSDGSVRLVGGSSVQGTVEICYNNLWGLVDSFNWGLAEAQVVCNQLGFGTQYSTAYPVSPFGRPNITVHLTNIGCSGTEQSLSDCTSTKLDISDAPSYPTVGGVQCQSNRTTVVVPSSTMMSNTSMMASTATPTSQAQAANSGITAAAAIFGVITLGLVVAVVVILGVMVYTQKKRRDANKALSNKKQYPGSSSVDERRGPREVINPLATETGFEDDNDDDTRRLQELIEESKLQ